MEVDLPQPQSQASQVGAYREAARARLRDRIRETKCLPQRAQSENAQKAIEFNCFTPPFVDLKTVCPNQQTVEKSPFIRLPGELRNYIYKLALATPSEEVQLIDTLVPPPLARVCKQIRTECLPFFFDVNEFHVILWKSEQEDTSSTKTLDEGESPRAETQYELDISCLTQQWLEQLGVDNDLPIMNTIHMHFDEMSLLKDKTLVLHHSNACRILTHGPECFICSKNERMVMPANFYEHASVATNHLEMVLAHMAEVHELANSVFAR